MLRYLASRFFSALDCRRGGEPATKVMRSVVIITAAAEGRAGTGTRAGMVEFGRWDDSGWTLEEKLWTVMMRRGK